ncbi:588_t:CDS:2 [Racocetra fulgida]|uniref:588_t:CDS:1 n=1 Tax=Racocetra fulgida TaxID=60492 RepID=A0A9N8W7J6_9GLOM|nr:588_t:CDS:2 [Racocetra fulgida]
MSKLEEATTSKNTSNNKAAQIVQEMYKKLDRKMKECYQKCRNSGEKISLLETTIH